MTREQIAYFPDYKLGIHLNDRQLNWLETWQKGEAFTHLEANNEGYGEARRVLTAIRKHEEAAKLKAFAVGAAVFAGLAAIALPGFWKIVSLIAAYFAWLNWSRGTDLEP